MPQPTGPLKGIRVVDVTTVVLGPFASQTLGDMGADVIKVETPDGDSTRQIGPHRSPGMAAYFAGLNRNKRSLVLDLKKPASKEALLRLVETADVFVHNMRLGAASRLGLDYETLRARNPRLIYAAASGFRKGSSMQDFPAYDDLIQGVSGTAALNAGPGGAPRYLPTVVVDKLTGSYLASMIGMALFHRERTGQGQEIHLPMMETILSFMLVEHLWHGTLDQPENGLGYPRMLTPHRRPYQTKDGHISVIAHSDAQWNKLFDAMGVPHYKDDPRFNSVSARTANIDAVYATLTEGMKSRTTDEWLAELRPADIPCGRANGLDDLFTDPYLVETNFFERHQHPTEGTVVVPAIPTRFSETPPNIHRYWPALGEHTRAVLAELGYSPSDIDAIIG
ncbi:CaiB/BaiF CoA transferase family protein [Rhodopila sp.]|uniref:CaiB/BaiF CoA transferase family protein n=1 Tax=Rhodopila sp. TaxID=2480087 RepID=UPI002CD8A2C4|nr:CoA transferase [Rhodopila sp.]HVZ08641.1 CoA transferase [Rhodopila sp.]